MPDGAGFEYQYEYATGTGKGTKLNVDGYYEHDVVYVDDDTTEITYSARGIDQIHRYSYGSMGTLDTHYGPAETAGDITTRGISYEYDPSGSDITEEVLFDNNEPSSWSQVKQYDAAHNVTNVSVSYGGSAPVLQMSMEYDPVLNLPTAVIDGDGSRIETVYTNGSPKTMKAFYSPSGSYDTQYCYYTSGLLRAVTNANQHTTTYGYDSDGNLTSITPQAGPIVTNTYDDLGFLKTTEFYVVESMFVSRRITEYDRDAKGRVEEITYPDGLTDSFKYNALGYLTNSVDCAGRVTDYTYAPSKKLTSVTRYLTAGGSNTSVKISYDLDEQVNVLSITEPRGRYVESYKLDVQDRVTSVTNIESQVRRIDYGVGDFVNSITRFDSSTITNVYDGAGRLSSATYNPESASPLTISYGYHEDSQLKDVSDDVSTNAYVYNLLNQMISQTSSVSSASSVAAYLYDPVGNTTNATVSYEGTAVSEISYTYDAGERLHTISTPVPDGSANSVFTHSYNPRNGALAKVENSESGITCSYGYDIMERLENITYRTAGGSLIRSIDYDYDEASMITNKTITGTAGSVMHAYEYDSIDRLKKETRIADGAAPVLMEYGYDLAGNRLSKNNKGTAVSYTLGTGNRLNSWSASVINSLTVDVRGTSSEDIGTDDRWGTLSVTNLTTQTGAKPQVEGKNFSAFNMTMQQGTNEFVAAIRDEAGNMGYDTNIVVYSVVTNGTFLTDAAGCVTNISNTGTGGYSDSMELEWDERYRLSSVAVASSTISYGYDVLNRKTSRTQSGTTEIYVYDGNQIVADLDDDGDLLRSYVWGQGIDNLLSMTMYGVTTNTYYPIKDHQNTVLALVDNSGVVVESYEYDAYGRTKVFSSSGSEVTTSAYGNRYTFQGREIDWATGLIYFRARWYDPDSGRWLSKDPIGIAGGLNLYTFCSCNPVNSTDPSGLANLNLYGENDFFYDYGNEVFNIDGVFSIAGHGQPQRIHDGRYNIPGSMSADTLWALIGGEEFNSEGNYDIIYLSSCFGASDDWDPTTTGENSVAQMLANATGLPVVACTGSIGPYCNPLYGGYWTQVNPQCEE